MNGSNVNLTRTLFDYFLAVSRVYFDQALDAINSSQTTVNVDVNQTQCGVQAIFNQIYTNADAAAELIELFQNISQGIRIIKQVHMYFHMYSLHTYILF